MSDMCVTGITVSVELKRSTYGGGDAENRFVSLKAEVPEGVPGLSYDDALIESLEIQLKAWESLMVAETSMGRMDSKTFNARRERAQTRFGKLIAFLKENPE